MLTNEEKEQILSGLTVATSRAGEVFFDLDSLYEAVSQIKAKAVEEGMAEGLLRSAEIISKHILKINSLGGMATLEALQSEILSALTQEEHIKEEG